MKTIAQQLNVKDFPFEIKDKNGNEIYLETSDGFWEKREYDSNGKQTYHENSTGYWEIREYDSDGNLIYYENSNEFWIKWEHDLNGNRIYFETSRGDVIDNRPTPVEGKIVEIDGKKYQLKEV